MDDDKKLESRSREALNEFEPDLPENAWNRLDAELNRDQALLYQGRARRFRNISAALLLLLLSFLGYHYLSTDVPPVEADLQVAERANPAFNNHVSVSPTPQIQIAAGLKQSKSEAFRSVPDKPDVLPGTNASQSVGAPNLNPVKIQAAGVPSLNIASGSPAQVSTTENGELALVPVITAGQIQPQAAPELLLNRPQKNEPDYREKTPVSRFEVGVYFSPDITWQQLHDNSNDDINQAAMYKSRENTLFSYHAGLEAGYKINLRFTISTGISLSNYCRSVSSPVMTTAGTSKDDMYFEYGTSNGIVKVPMDASHAYMNPGEELSVEAVCEQRLQSLYIPLDMKYRLTYGRTSVFIRGGLYFSQLVRSKATVWYESYAPVVINDTKGLNNSTFGFNAGIGFGYAISGRTGLVAEPVIRGAFTSNTRNTPVNSYPWSAGIKLGLQTSF